MNPINNLASRYIAERKKLIQSYFSHLNDKQQEAVCATDGALLILAGAGSGKTTVLINRILNLMKFGNASDTDELPFDFCEDNLNRLLKGGETAENEAAFNPVKPWNILAITFTNKAADEMKKRLEQQLGDAALDIWACTFHSACVRILRREAELLGFPSNFTIYDTSDSQSVIKKILKDFDIDEKQMPVRMVLSEISNAKTKIMSPDDYLKEAASGNDPRKTALSRVYREYTHRLFAAGAMDFDDLLLYAVKALEDYPESRSYWQRKFKYILVDEYQDTNKLQYQLVSILAQGSGNICVVGDDDQSIYKFRGATIDNILSFESQFKGCRTIRLEQNYRSTEVILEAANAVISNNRSRKGKHLWTESSGGNKICLYSADTEADEASYVANQILLAYSKGGKWNENAVLYRMNAQSNSIEYALKRSGIPYRILGGTRFFDRAEVKDILAYLCVLQNPKDDLRLIRIINTPVRGIGASSVEKAAAIAEQHGISLYEVICSADDYPDLSRSAIKMRQFAEMMNALIAFAEVNTPDLIYDEVLARTGYLKVLEEKNTAEDDTRAENVKELKSSILGYLADSDDHTLAGYLANVALYTDLDNYDKNADSIVLMTLHSAKGLEFDNVYITGMEENIFPGARSCLEIEDLEEERRLCYVGITRAKKNLHLVHAKIRMLFGRTSQNRISRFIDEIPEEYLEQKKITARSRRTSASGSFSMPSVSEHRGMVKRTTNLQAPTQKTEQFQVGDLVDHKAFGKGKIVAMKPMGNDFLTEINFERVGGKKLMLRVAAMNMKKLMENANA